MRLPAGSALLAVLTALVLTGCGGSPDPLSGPSLPVAAPPAAAPSELAAQKKDAGIRDCPRSDADAAPVDSGLPDLMLDCLGGGRKVRLAGLRGRPMMINVWAQWCGPCQDEAPFLSEVAKANDPELVILGVDYDDPRPDRAIEFARVLGWRF